MEIKIEIGDNLKSIMERAINKGYVDDVEDIVAAFDLKSVVESYFESLVQYMEYMEKLERQNDDDFE